MRVLVTGAAGQVGMALREALGPGFEVAACDRASLDLRDADAIRRRVREAGPAVIVNAAAYTAVDKAESEREVAHAINGVAPGVLAEEAARAGAVLVHFSTDYVFDGRKGAPYVEDDATAPLNAYGESKLAGERAIAATGAAHLILRTSWVYGPHGANFLRTMLRLAASRPELRVVDDQHGAPTSSLQLAALVRELLERHGPRGLAQASGTFHATAAGETTWCGFAREIFALRARSDTAFIAPRVVAIPTSEYPTPARRPANSRLDNGKLRRAFGVALAPWQDALRESLARA